MRRPVGIKCVAFCFLGHTVFPCRVATVAIFPSALFMSDTVSLGASRAFSLQPMMPMCFATSSPILRWKLGQAITITGTRRFGFIHGLLEEVHFCHRNRLQQLGNLLCQEILKPRSPRLRISSRP